MRRGFSGGIDAVVTTHAVACDSDVIEFRRLPRESVVAVAAVLRGDDVTRGLAGGACAVVTGRARPAYFIVIKVSRRHPRVRCVTCAAVLRARHMRGGFRRPSDSRAARVTAAAVNRRSFEYGVDVARLAWLVSVSAGEFEARGQVIEVPRRWRGLLRKGNGGQQEKREYKSSNDVHRHGVAPTAALRS